MEKPELRLAVGVVLIEALGWSALSMMLSSGGHSPSGPPLLPITPSTYYATQVWFAPPVVLVGFALQTLLIAKLTRLDRATAATIASVGVSVPTIVIWQCGDLLAYAAGGFDALGTVMRYTVPLALLTTIALTATLCARKDVGRAKSIMVGVAVLVVRGLVFAPFMR